VKELAIAKKAKRAKKTKSFAVFALFVLFATSDFHYRAACSAHVSWLQVFHSLQPGYIDINV
jgi:hypothetical protein